MTAPGWFTKALEVPYSEKTLEVQGVPIHTLRWSNPGAPGLILIHGGAAHAHWWTFLAPFFQNDYDVIAIDLSGHGDSGRRESYPRETWAAEVIAIAEDAKFPGPPILVGHSMGGLVAIVTAALYGEKLAGAIIVDSPVQKPNPESAAARQKSAFGGARVYPDFESGVARFRLVPGQPCEMDFVIDHVARSSLMRVESGGWTWKFDPAVFSISMHDRMADFLSHVRTRVAMLRGAFSTVVPPETAQEMYDLLARSAPLVEIPEAHHHLILDQPLAFIAATRALLSDWQHSKPSKPGPMGV